jgi:hypothetical protein
LELDRPDRRTRRQRGKSDPIDAEAAARAVLAGVATAPARRRDGIAESIRALRAVRSGAIKARTGPINQLKGCWGRSRASEAVTGPLPACQPFSALADRRHRRTPITNIHSVITVGPMMVRISEAMVGSPVRAWMSPARIDPIPAKNATQPSHRG